MTPLLFQCKKYEQKSVNAELFHCEETHYCKGRCHISNNRLSKGPHGTMLQRSQKRPGSQQNFQRKMWISSEHIFFIKDSMPLDRQAPDTRLKMVGRRGYSILYTSLGQFEAGDLQNAAQNLSVVTQEPPFGTCFVE